MRDVPVHLDMGLGCQHMGPLAGGHSGEQITSQLNGQVNHVLTLLSSWKILYSPMCIISNVKSNVMTLPIRPHKHSVQLYHQIGRSRLLILISFICILLCLSYLFVSPFNNSNLDFNTYQLPLSYLTGVSSLMHKRGSFGSNLSKNFYSFTNS